MSPIEVVVVILVLMMLFGVIAKRQLHINRINNWNLLNKCTQLSDANYHYLTEDFINAKPSKKEKILKTLDNKEIVSAKDNQVALTSVFKMIGNHSIEPIDSKVELNLRSVFFSGYQNNVVTDNNYSYLDIIELKKKVGFWSSIEDKVDGVDVSFLTEDDQKLHQTINEAIVKDKETLKVEVNDYLKKIEERELTQKADVVKKITNRVLMDTYPSSSNLSI